MHDARANITELTRRLHELEIELRRLENEREELTAAYKEAEAVSLHSHRIQHQYNKTGIEITHIIWTWLNNKIRISVKANISGAPTILSEDAYTCNRFL